MGAEIARTHRDWLALVVERTVVQVPAGSRTDTRTSCYGSSASSLRANDPSDPSLHRTAQYPGDPALRCGTAWASDSTLKSDRWCCSPVVPDSGIARSQPHRSRTDRRCRIAVRVDRPWSVWGVGCAPGPLDSRAPSVEERGFSDRDWRPSWSAGSAVRAT